MIDDQLSVLLAEPDEDERWVKLRQYVSEHTSAARVVGERALTSEDPRTRELAAGILGSVASVDRRTAAGIATLLIPRLAVERDADVLDSVIVALGHAGDARARARVLELADHPDENVRFAVAFALPNLGLEDDDSLAVLRQLSADTDEDVRVWATAALAENEAGDDDIPALLAALDK